MVRQTVMGAGTKVGCLTCGQARESLRLSETKEGQPLKSQGPRSAKSLWQD